MIRSILLLALAAAVVPAAAQTPEIRPGLWEFSLAGAPGKGMTQQLCFTPQMVKDMKGLAAKGDPASDCKSSNETVAGKTRSFDIACTKPSAYNARITITIDGPDNFSMSQQYKVDRGGKTDQGTMAITYRRIGECKK